MTIFNYAAREITAKIVYYGPAKCGKTTNLEYIHSKADLSKKGKLLSMATEADRTIFFDLLPMNVGSIGGFKIKIQLLTVPGQVFYNSTRRVVLTGADGVVFVADSQAEKLKENIESIENLKENLKANSLSYDTIPLVLQLNKQDISNLSPEEELLKLVNKKEVMSFPAAAINGSGVMETYEAIVEKVLKTLETTTGKAVKPLTTSASEKEIDPHEKERLKVVAGAPTGDEIKSTATSAQPDASEKSESYLPAKGLSAAKIRSTINMLVNENKKIKKFCFQLKNRLEMLEERLKQKGN